MAGLRQHHGAELAGTDQADANGTSRSVACLEQTGEIHLQSFVMKIMDRGRESGARRGAGVA
jgi:hypothetical protein